jgi:hypothetical protein
VIYLLQKTNVELNLLMCLFIAMYISKYFLSSKNISHVKKNQLSPRRRKIKEKVEVRI